MTIKNLGDLLIYLGAIAGALTAIGWLIYRVGVRPFVRWLKTEITETREQVTQTRDAAEAVQAEVSHNHGHSIKDVVDRTERKVDDITRRFDAHLTNHPGS
jgi:flagellar biosynthesis/type III secretory pathway M-ring protein FliF/YscJ